MEYAVEFNNVWKSFRRGERAMLLRDAIPLMLNRLKHHRSFKEESTFWALKDVSFKVKKGEVLGIIGQNGAGKTTALTLLAGIMKPNKGQVITRGKVSCLIIAGAGFHPQFTGRENIYLNGAVIGMSKSEITRKFDSIVEFAGYGLPDYKKFIDTPVKRYSAGMFVRLGFAVAAHVDPDILLVDEIIAVGDAAFQQRCFNYMDSLKKSNATIIMVSHSMPNIINYCDRAILLKEGAIVAEGERHKVVDILENEISKNMNWFSVENVPTSKPRGEAVLKNVKFNNATHTKDGLCFNFAQQIEVSFNYDCMDYSLSDTTFSVVVYRKRDGCRCFTVFSHFSGHFPSKREGCVQLVIKDHNLLPDNYVIDLEISSIKGSAPLAVYRERSVLIKPADNIYLNAQLYGLYQPGNISWHLS